MKHPVKAYFKYLGESGHYQRSPQTNGLYYNLETQIRQLIFYDKLKEQKRKRFNIPDEFKNKHILRFEVRWLKDLCGQFNLPEITAEMLYDGEFYNTLVDRWQQEYFNIQKINNRTTVVGNYKCTKSVNNDASFSVFLTSDFTKEQKTKNGWC